MSACANGPIIVWLPWAKPPQSLNDRMQHFQKAKLTKQALEEARWAIRASKPGKCDVVALILNFRVMNRRRRDVDNLAWVSKVTSDALVQEGVLEDDGWQHVRFSGQTIHPPETGKPAAMWLEIWDYEEWVNSRGHSVS